MINTINFQAWLNLFALTVEMFSGFPVNENFSVKTCLDDLSKIHFNSNKKNKGLYIDFYCEKTGEKLISYILIPWQDLFPLSAKEDNMVTIMENVKMVTVTPFCMLFEINAHPTPNEEQVVIIEKITNMMEYLFDVRNTNTPVKEKDAYTLSDGTQVIRLKSYPFYTDLQVAIPGSGNIHAASIKKRFPNKMIRLTRIPEIGEVKTSWLASGQAEMDPFLLDNQNEILSVYQNVVQKCQEDISEESRKKINEQTRVQFKKMLASKKNKQLSVDDFLITLLNKFTLIDYPTYKTLNSNNLYPGYQPKTSPDDVLDYRPSILEEMTELPESNLKNLPILIEFYKEFKAKAKEEPGEWIEGNIFLGAAEKEYHASNTELLLSETGKKIKQVIDHNNVDDIIKILKKNKIKLKKICYTEFSYIHYDVMGSGRFFYIDSMDKVEFELY